MKIRKFYIQTVKPMTLGNKQLLGLRKEIQEDEARKILDNFFKDENSTNAQQVKAEAWAYIIKGEQVTVNDSCISSHVFNEPATTSNQ